MNHSSRSFLLAALSLGICFPVTSLARSAPAPTPPEQLQSAPALDPQKDHILGKEDAPVSVIVYTDYECPFCQRHHKTMKQLVRRYRGTVNVAYRHFPLTSIHPYALDAAAAAECAAEQGGDAAFWKMTDSLFRQTWEKPDFAGWAGKIGLKAGAFQQCLHRGDVQTSITATMPKGINGTPTSFVVENATGKQTVVSGAYPLSTFAKSIDAILGRTPPAPKQPPASSSAEAKPVIPSSVAGDHSRGKKSATLLIVEYGGVTEPFSKEFTPTMEKLLATYPDDVQWTFRHFPMNSLYPQDAGAAEAAECAADQGGQKSFWAFLDAAHAQTVYDMAAAARAAGINADTLTTCLGMRTHEAAVQQALKNADALNISGSPTSFLINRKTGNIQEIGGAQAYDVLETLVQSALTAAGK